MRDLSYRIGQRYGKLVIISRVKETAPKAVRWLCQCDCGNMYESYSSGLYSGNTTHCGCNHANKIKSTVHGQRKLLSRTYNTWRNLRQRCDSPKDKSYKWYGGKGITYDPKWKTYLGFLSDMGERPVGMTLDRINPTKNYTKENCKWSTNKEQANNRIYSKQLTTTKGEITHG